MVRVSGSLRKSACKSWQARISCTCLKQLPRNAMMHGCQPAFLPPPSPSPRGTLISKVCKSANAVNVSQACFPHDTLTHRQLAQNSKGSRHQKPKAVRLYAQDPAQAGDGPPKRLLKAAVMVLVKSLAAMDDIVMSLLQHNSSLGHISRTQFTLVLLKRYM